MKKLVEEIIKSLIDNPQDWFLGNEKLEHKSGVSIFWIMNKDEIKPLRGNMGIEIREENIMRFIKQEEYEPLWKAIKDCKSAEDLKDELILKRLC